MSCEQGVPKLFMSPEATTLPMLEFLRSSC
jgi:hypothetical protein